MPGPLSYTRALSINLNEIEPAIWDRGIISKFEAERDEKAREG